MYQFYYADKSSIQIPHYSLAVDTVFSVTAIRPTMWEEHCLECSAPLCFENCRHYEARIDGRCKRFENGIKLYPNKQGCCGQGVRIKFRKWANMMTILFPSMYDVENDVELTAKNQKLGENLDKLLHSHLPVKVKWELVRTVEYLRRRKLKLLSGMNNQPDAFVFHGYNFEKQSYHLIIEIYDDHTPVFRTSLLLQPGENLFVLDKSKLNAACWAENYLVKVYPENNMEVELDILWCDFVKGNYLQSDQPASTVKCVVWDLDNTLWDGTLIETDDFNDLHFKPGVLDLIKQLDERGIIQSIASKNDFEAAWNVLERLEIADYFLYPQIHWNAKSDSMKQIAENLNIGIDTLALIDDSAFEREQVHSIWPQVRTYDATEVFELILLPEFKVMITEESKRRRMMYKAEEKRNQVRSGNSTDIVEFLKRCNLKIEIFQPKTESEILRCYELVIRTNQLNMSGRKYTSEEFRNILLLPDCSNFAFSCEDDFGSYGIVGFGQYRICNNQVEFTEFAMSCRVAGKYVESALFNAILEKSQCKTGNFSVNKTKKNALLRRTLEEIGFSAVNETETFICYTFDGNLKQKQLVHAVARNCEL